LFRRFRRVNPTTQLNSVVSCASADEKGRRGGFDVESTRSIARCFDGPIAAWAGPLVAEA